MQKIVLTLIIIVSGLSCLPQGLPNNQKPLRVAVVGLVHDHVNWILGREKRGDIELVGIAEPDQKVVEHYAKRYGFDKAIVYKSMEELVSKTKPEAVLAFNNIYDHLKVVEYCAPRGIHVMVEKPLAVNAQHAMKMLELAKKHNIYLLTNYETTWYGSNAKAYDMVKQQHKIGEIRKIVFHTGHRGPVEIGCSPQFLQWLTDPVLNGGGALTDFGCYGANIATWLMDGELPLTVSAVTQQIKPDIYPKVDDEATIIVTYRKAQVIIQASWNWPYGRKDMEIYGRTGYLFCLNGQDMLYRENEKSTTVSIKADPLVKSEDDPFVYFANVIRGNIKMKPYDLSSPGNNEIMVKILDAAKHSARTGKVVKWDEFYKPK